MSEELKATREDAYRLFLLIFRYSSPKLLEVTNESFMRLKFEHFEQWIASRGVRFARFDEENERLRGALEKVHSDSNEPHIQKLALKALKGEE